MNFSQLHERLRQEVSRRIQRGLLTGSFLAAQTKLQPSHISNFLRRERRLSLRALDLVLDALSLSAEDLVLSTDSKNLRGESSKAGGSVDCVPLVSPASAIQSPAIPRSAVLEVVEIPGGILENFVPRLARGRRNWQRFVAIRVDAQQAAPMSPVLNPQSILILDRHYNALAPYRPPQPNIYGVDYAGTLVFRYVTFQSPHIVLRPWSLQHPVELLEIEDNAFPTAHIVGRVCLCISQL